MKPNKQKKQEGKIEGIDLIKGEQIYLEVDNTKLPESYVNITVLVEKMNEIIYTVNLLQEKKEK